MKFRGSLIRKKDLQRYKAIIRKPVKLKLKKSITLHTAPRPAAGKVLSIMIGKLDKYRGLNENSTKDDKKAAEIIDRLIKIMRYGDRKKESFHLDLCEKKKPLCKFTSNTYFKNMREKIKAKRNSLRDKQGHTRPSSSTTHISVLAPDGDAVSVTSSINKYFGSHIMSPSTGIILNNQMADFSNDTSSKKNRVKGGRRPLSAMCPAIFTDAKGNVTLVIGAAGGLAIGPVLLQIIARTLYLGESIKESIDAPRFHAYKDVIRFENNFPKKTRDKLKDLGHKSQLNFMLRSVGIGIKRNEQKICANYDYRKGGAVDGLNS